MATRDSPALHLRASAAALTDTPRCAHRLGGYGIRELRMVVSGAGKRGAARYAQAVSSEQVLPSRPRDCAPPTRERCPANGAAALVRL
eukprot:CAMPEP_0196768842 /NCGR_PEP_ID=MMETSP1104-20130614/145_1 /TAXON_ID=33652 /ORGANISM="Cafeteria sp., Strain Caron Lab Isolate" /LENGTH=87 /DNA_ID=CAMNT_0042138917 /DNA_START=118 /DNA_END=381 /DNA_ORIENTATION=+